MYLLDTNVVSEMRKLGNGRCDKQVATWSHSVDLAATYLSVVTLLEIEISIQTVARRDADQAHHLEAWFTALQSAYQTRTLVIDAPTAIRAARLHVPDPRPDRDTLIAACAAESEFCVVTRNTRDFDGMGVLTHNPWISST